MTINSTSVNAGIKLKGLTKKFGLVRAVDAIDLELPESKFVCLLGPSGCGKTTLLRLIAGLEIPDGGDIVFDDQSINQVPPHQRDFGMVFQSLALFPHLNIAQNVGYALKIRGRPQSEINQRVTELLDMVHLPGVGDRGINQLSGGQRQRVAIARALAIEPRLFLLDEPLSALDAKLREAMQVELRQLQRDLGITTIVVTHDQREAMTMADHVVVMKDGKILQHGPPLEIYRNPTNAFVADFIGTSNLLSCVIVDDRTVSICGHAMTVNAIPSDMSSGDHATLSIRPEELQVAGENEGKGLFEARVTFIRDLGAQVEMMLTWEGHDLVATMSPKDRPIVSADDKVFISLPSDTCKVLAP